MRRGRLVQIAVVALTLMSAGMRLPPAWSGQDDGRLNGLFERLKTASVPAEAKDVEQQIWQIWLESDDPLVERLMRQGIAAMSLQQYDLALQHFDDIVKHAPQFGEGWNKRATLYYLLQDYRRSVLDIERTLELEPRHFGALSGLGLIYDALGEPQAALRAFEAALAIDPHLEGIRTRVEELRRELRGRPT